MFALSTNNNTHKIFIIMNKFFSLLAAAFLFTAASATASTTTQANDNLNDVVTLQTAGQSVTMYVAIEKPNGEVATLTARYGNMAQALVGYHQFVSTMPIGSKVLAADFTDQNGRVIFSATV